LVAVAALGLVAYSLGSDIHNQQKLIAQLSANSNGRLPTLSEVFHLRSECAALGQKILDGNGAPPTLTQGVDSNYDQTANRCYIESTVSSAVSVSFATPSNSDYYLYDGQTGKLLAYATAENGYQAGRVFVPHRAIPNATQYDDALEYINSMMNEGL
jgi:hypothetical protein